MIAYLGENVVRENEYRSAMAGGSYGLLGTVSDHVEFECTKLYNN